MQIHVQKGYMRVHISNVSFLTVRHHHSFHSFSEHMQTHYYNHAKIWKGQPGLYKLARIRGEPESHAQS